jgi:hypothetical protein
MGYYVGRARFASQQRGGLFVLALLVPILLHGMYDFPLMVVSHYKKLMPHAQLPGLAALLVLVTLGTLIIDWRLALRLVRRMRAEQEQDRGTALAGAIPVPVPAPVVAAARSFSLVGWVQVLSGGALLSSAGILVVLLGIGVATGAGSGSVTDVVLGGAALSVLPTLVGLWLFRRGIRCLNRAESAVSS